MKKQTAKAKVEHILGNVQDFDQAAPKHLGPTTSDGRPVAVPSFDGWIAKRRTLVNERSLVELKTQLCPEALGVPKDARPTSQKKGSKNYRVIFKEWVVEVHLATRAYRLIKNPQSELLTKEAKPNISWAKLGGPIKAWKEVIRRTTPGSSL